MKYTRDSVKQTEYEQARRDYPHYAALCDAEDALRTAKSERNHVDLHRLGQHTNIAAGGETCCRVLFPPVRQEHQRNRTNCL